MSVIFFSLYFSLYFSENALLFLILKKVPLQDRYCTDIGTVNKMHNVIAKFEKISRKPLSTNSFKISSKVELYIYKSSAAY